MGLIATKPVIGFSDNARLKTSLLSYIDYLENWNFAYSRLRYYSLPRANNKGADQSAQMRRLVCAFVVRQPPKTVFSR